MSLLLKNGQVYYNAKLQKLDILIENDQIKKVDKGIVDNAKEIKVVTVEDYLKSSGGIRSDDRHKSQSKSKRK